MAELTFSKDDELVMRLLYYFITVKGYNPIILHGVKNEIWLENLSNDLKIVRIVSDYIHNDDQLNLDLYKTRQIVKKIEKKTFTFHANTLSIFINLGENVNFKQVETFDQHLLCANVKNMEDLNQYEFIMSEFPTIANETNFQEKGMELFMKITEEINQKNQADANKMEDVFKRKTPTITYSLLLINAICFLITYIVGYRKVIYFGASVADLIRAGEYYRLLTSAFLHANIFHILCNMYALYVLGPQLESFFGKAKFLTIYLGSAVIGNLLSMLFSNGASIGASGAIFGLFGAMLYFGYHYRVYLGGVLNSQLIPLILINLMLGFFMSGIDGAAHVGGLVGGVLLSMAVGVKYKSTLANRINGVIMTLIFVSFLIYMSFVGI